MSQVELTIVREPSLAEREIRDFGIKIIELIRETKNAFVSKYPPSEDLEDRMLPSPEALQKELERLRKFLNSSAVAKKVGYKKSRSKEAENQIVFKYFSNKETKQLTVDLYKEDDGVSRFDLTAEDFKFVYVLNYAVALEEVPGGKRRFLGFSEDGKRRFLNSEGGIRYAPIFYAGEEEFEPINKLAIKIGAFLGKVA